MIEALFVWWAEVKMETLLAVLSAFSAVAAALYARRALAPSMAAVLSDWLVQFSDDQFGKDMSALREWQKQHGKAFAKEYLEFVRQNPTDELVASRRRVSQFFKNIGRLSRTGLMEDQLIARAFGRRPFDFCVEVLEPLDQAVSQDVAGRDDDVYWKAFYERIRTRAVEAGIE